MLTIRQRRTPRLTLDRRPSAPWICASRTPRVPFNEGEGEREIILWLSRGTFSPSRWRKHLKVRSYGTTPGPTTHSFEPRDFPETSKKPAIGGLRRRRFALRETEVVKTLTNLGLEPVGNTPKEVAEIMRQELPVYAEAVTAAGLRRR
jgi:hypothetical protein